MPRVKVCGVPVLVKDLTSYGGGHIYPGARDIGSHARVGARTAKSLFNALGISRRLPKPGHEVNLCPDTYLGNRSGYYEVVIHRSGGFEGRK